MPQIGLPQSLMRRLWRLGKCGEIKENFSWLKENAAAKQVNNLCKSAFILNFQVALLGFRRTLRSTPLFFKSIGETEEVLSKVEEEKLNQARYDCLSSEHHSTCQPL